VAEPGDGEVLVRVGYLSIDPAMRGWMNEGRSYIAPVPRELSFGPGASALLKV
jgi:hypothetical protein